MNSYFRFYKAGLVALSFGLLVACQPWDLPAKKSQRQCTTPGGQFTSTITQLQVAFTISQPTGTTDRVEWDFGDTKTQTTTALTTTHLYTAPGTYTVKAKMANLCGDATATTLTQTVTVTNAFPPTVVTQGATDITINSAKLAMVVTNNGNADITEYGICYSKTSTTPTIADLVIAGTGTLAVNSVVTLTAATLEPNTVYYYRGYARNISNAAPNPPSYGNPVKSFQTPAAEDITRDMVLNMPFDGLSLKDISGYNNNGIAVGSPTYTTDHKGRANSAVLLNGKSDYFYAPDAASLRPDSLTVSLWVRMNALPTGAERMTLYNKSRFSDSGGEQYSSLIKLADTGSGITINTDIKQNAGCKIGGWQTFPVTSNIPLINMWRHIVFTYEKRTARMYLDGVLVSEKTDLVADKIDNCPGGELKFGSQFSGGPQFLNGALDDIRIYRRALTVAQVKALTNL